VNPFGDGWAGPALELLAQLDAEPAARPLVFDDEHAAGARNREPEPGKAGGEVEDEIELERRLTSAAVSVEDERATGREHGVLLASEQRLS
jgi:hypothetical protein